VPRKGRQSTGARARIVETTARLLRKNGYQATGLDKILKESGAPKGSLYYHFPRGKSQLASEALELAASRMAAGMLEMLSSQRNPAGAIRALFGGTSAALAKSSYMDGCPIATVTLEMASDNPEVRHVCETSFEAWRQILASHLLGAGFKKSRAEALATLILASLEGGLLLSRAQRSVKPLSALARELIKLVRANSADQS